MDLNFRPAGVAACTLLLALVAPVDAKAEVVVDFNSIMFAANTNYPSFTEDGFDLTPNVPLFASWGTAIDNYAGSAALFHNQPGGVTTLTRQGGGAFDLNSIDLSELYANPVAHDVGGDTTVVFEGVLSGGGAVSFDAALDMTFGFETFDFGSTFLDVISVSWTQSGAFHQFDNIVLDGDGVTTVPEPSALALAGFGLAALAARRRRRRT